MTTYKPFRGLEPRLVLAFDVGTTFSGISYAILTPNEVPKISGVNRFPAQEYAGGDAKIPSIVYYDSQGTVRAVGAEAMDERCAIRALEEGWSKVEWFKMHLRPQSMHNLSLDGTDIPALPSNKSIVDVFADFLAYLLACARTYITDTHAEGNVLWRSLESSIVYILTHPNGWTGLQQAQMRWSATQAGLVPDSPAGQSRLRFVTEGEASLHFCISSGLADRLIRPGNSVVVADVGGGTVDVSSYRITSIHPLQIEESFLPECRAQGSVFVSRRAHQHIERTLYNSKYGSPEDIGAIADAFDKTTKRTFRDPSEAVYVKFGSLRDKDEEFNIQHGQLKMDGQVVAEFFEGSIQSLMDVISEQKKQDDEEIAVFLVGGFAASPWLFSQLQVRLGASSYSLSRPDGHTSKAVADGAISFYLDRVVTHRRTKQTLGLAVDIPYDPNNPGHRRREAQRFLSSTGKPRVSGYFSQILKKGTLLSEAAEFKRVYYIVGRTRKDLMTTNLQILSYVGPQSDNPLWVDEKIEDFPKFCDVVADLSSLALGLTSSKAENRQGQSFYQIKCEVVILFGLTETRAEVRWKENGVQKRSPATIVYNDEQ